MADIDTVPAGAIPSDQFEAAAAPAQAAIPNGDSDQLPEGAIPSEQFESREDAYGGAGQQTIAALEGAAEGVAGPLATLAETKLLHVPEEDIRGRRAENPWTHGIGQGVGFIGGALTGTGEAALLEKVGAGAVEAAGLANASSLAAKTGAAAVRQATEMAVMASGDQVSNMLLHDPDTSAQSAIADVGIMAALGGGTGAFMAGAVSPLWKATVGDKLTNALSSVSKDITGGIADGVPDSGMRPIVKKILATYGGVSEKNIDEYLANHASIQGTPEFQEIYDTALEHLHNIGENLHTAKASYKDLESKMMDELKDRGFDAKLAHQVSTQAFKDAQSKFAVEVQDQALNAGRQIAGAVEELRNKVVNGSTKAYDVLDKSGKDINLSGFYSKAETLAKDLEAEGTQEALKQAAQVRAYATGVMGQVGENPSAVAAKQLIQGLDKVSKYDFNAAQFDKNMSRAYKSLRHDLDTTLKDAIPEYKAAMKPVAEDTNLLASLNRYGDDESAVKSVKGLTNPAKYKNEWAQLEQLEKKTGIKFTEDIKPYADPDIKAKLVKALPQYAEAEKTASTLQALKDPATQRAIEEQLMRSEQAGALKAAESEAEKVKGLTPRNLQGALKSAATEGKSLANEAALKNLPGINGKTMPELMNLLRIRDIFDKDATRGSKHVNLYAGLMGALGAVTGGIGHIAGMAGAGAGLGAVVDKHGPGLVRSALDKYMTHFGDVAMLAKEKSPGVSRSLMHAVLMSPETQANGEAFKAGIDYIHAVKSGTKALNVGVANVFNSATKVLTDSQLPSQLERMKLDKLVAQSQGNPDQFAKNQEKNSAVGHYLPQHQAALTAASTTVVGYLQSLKPKPVQNNPLDTPIKPSAAEEARYNRALDIAINPITVLDHVKQGTLQASDIQDLRSMYPSLYTAMAQRISDQLVNQTADKSMIPYRVKMSMSLFLGQPLDMSMQPASIQSAQPKMQQAPQQNNGKKPNSNNSRTSMEKANKMYQTPGQNAEHDRSTRD